MGLISSIFSSFIGKVICCKDSKSVIYLSCCGNVENSINNNKTELDNNVIGLLCNGEYILKTHKLTKNLYENNNIAKFKIDADGMISFLTSNIESLIGVKPNKLNLGFTTDNMLKEDFIPILQQWINCIQREIPHISKQRYFKNDLIYIIIESYPIHTRGIFKGMEGIIMKVSKKIWDQFELNIVNKEKPRTIHFPIRNNLSSRENINELNKRSNILISSEIILDKYSENKQFNNDADESISNPIDENYNQSIISNIIDNMDTL